MIRVLLTMITAVGVFLASASGARAVPRFVDLDKEIENASVVAIVRIAEYRDHELRSRRVSNDRLVTCNYSQWRNWQRPTRAIVGDLAKVETGLWPPVGSEVIVVIDSTDAISLFARRVGNEWSFWSPFFTLSVARFKCRAPARPVERLIAPGDSMSWGGCLVPDETLRQWLR